MQPIVIAMNLGQVLVPALIVIVFLSLFFVSWAMTKRYKRIPPNAIGIIFGKRRVETDSDGKTVERGFKLVTGGGVFVLPIVEEYMEMSTAAFQLEIEEKNIPTKRNVGVDIQGVATCRISSKPDEQSNAVQAFLGKDLVQIGSMIRDILRGHLRSIVGKLDIEELLRERGKFNEQVVAECSQELSRLGIQIVTLVVQDVRDNQGYIDALGRQAVANTKRDAEIAAAQAESETKVKTSQARREAAEAEAANNAKIADAQRDLALQVAGNKVRVDTETAKAELAGALSKTAQEQQLRVLEAQRDAAAAEAQVSVHQKEALANKEHLHATKIITAEAERTASIIAAESAMKTAEIEAQRVQIQAEGVRAATIKKSEGDAQAVRVNADAKAEATRKTMTADADGQKAALLAQAEGTRSKLLAEAEGKKQSLLAEAEGKKQTLLAEAQGTDQLAEAMKKLDASGRLMLVLDRLPILLKDGGDAGSKIVAAAFEPIGKSLGSIKEIRVVDMGSGGKTANGVLETMGAAVPGIVIKAFVALKGAGIDPTELMKTLKLDPAELQKLIGNPLSDESAGSPPTKS